MLLHKEKLELFFSLQLRIIALKLLNLHFSVSVVSSIINISKRPLYYLSQSVRQRAEIAAPGKPGRKRQIDRIVDNYVTLVQRCSLSLIPFSRNENRVKDLRVVALQKISETSDDDLLLLDETRFNLRITKLFGWSPKGKKATTLVTASKGQNLSVIAFISCRGLEAYEVTDGAFNGELLCDFLESFDEEILISRKIVMDNARWHYNEEAQRLISERGCEVIFNAPYSPQLNPIEEVFNLAKQRYRCIRPLADTRDIMRQYVHEIFTGLFTNNFTAYLAHMREWAVKGINREDF
ncbi:MAG: hypothetical protein EZS28_004003 [Streblomastix strix]|uniref:Tc1-like transposase DDE domain-containing protein n=1 Tax=Streblomastix strix TaxID=222440 RepID=A0A5J4WZP5_9EUKA|nr:MAG: hypothetical protein EZS28_004003 [Streblomastix strix]